MSTPQANTPSGTALLVMDVQCGITGRYAEGTDYLPRLAATINGARAHGIPVIYVVIGFRDGHPDISRNNQSFTAMAGSDRFTPGDPGAQVHPDVAPQEGDVIVTKRRVSAFAGSDLDLVLRSMEVGHLVLTGIATSGVVLSTLRQAADLDFGLTVLSDGCLDADDEVHRVLMQWIFPRQASVMTAHDWQDAQSFMSDGAAQETASPEGPDPGDELIHQRASTPSVRAATRTG